MSNENDTVKREQFCGIIMPISSIDGRSDEHWEEVLSILKNIIHQAGFESKLVSDAGDSGIIQKRIVQNLYNNQIVICDVSGKNPNVMFELGLRLAFDKPTVIIKDDETDYSFDTAVIEHIEYPKDLNYLRIEEFNEQLESKIKATHKKSISDPNYSTFLKHFGEYKITDLEKKEITSEEYIPSTLEDIKSDLSSIKRNQIIERDNLNSNKYSLKEFATVKNKIEQYINDKGIDDFDQIKNIESRQQLINYLYTHKGFIKYRSNPVRLAKIVDDVINNSSFAFD